MGCLATENYLILNQSHLTEDRIAGIVFSAPFFGIAESVGANPVKKMVIKGLACIADEFVVNKGQPSHMLCHNMQYQRQC